MMEHSYMQTDRGLRLPLWAYWEHASHHLTNFHTSIHTDGYVRTKRSGLPIHPYILTDIHTYRSGLPIHPYILTDIHPQIRAANASIHTDRHTHTDQGCQCIHVYRPTYTYRLGLPMPVQCYKITCSRSSDKLSCIQGLTVQKGLNLRRHCSARLKY